MTNGVNSRGVGYSEIVFFESTLSSHSAVASFERFNDIQFIIKRTFEVSDLNIVFVSEYRLGQEFAYSILDEFDDVNVIVNNGNWNVVSLEQEEFHRNTGVHVIRLKNFLGALNNPAFG